MQGQIYDVAIIGGGISGTAVARDAAGRGLSVYLCEAGDLGAGATSVGPGVVHGRLGAMEGFRIGAMRTAVAERDILWRAAPHVVRPLRFLIPHHGRLASPRLMRLGLAAYDRVLRTALPRSSEIAGDDPELAALNPYFGLAFAVWDCVAPGARLAVLNAIDARTRGASINPRTRCIAAERQREAWRLVVEEPDSDSAVTISARVLVNAAGAEAGEVANRIVDGAERIDVALTRHVSIAVRRPHDGITGYALFDADGGIVHVVPHGPGIMMVGPLAAPHAGPSSAADATDGDIRHLADVFGQYFERPLKRADIVAVQAGVSALPAGSGAAHDGDTIVDGTPDVAPLVHVFGGDLVGHRRLAEKAVDRLGRFFAISEPWTHRAALPGGGVPVEGLGDLARALRAAYPFVGDAHARRLVETYGMRATTLLTGARRMEDLGARFGDDLTEAEVRFLCEEEWATSAADILWRRTGLGPLMLAGEVHRLEALIATFAVKNWLARALP